jgi:hypothetical protein
MIVRKVKEKAPAINIEELHRNRDQKIKQKIGSFKEVLRLCHLQIKKAARDTNECYCFYQIPPMVYGYPLYDINSCTLYVVEKLVENGFNVVYTHPNLLLISWYQKPKPLPPVEVPISQPSNQNIFRPTTDFRPSNNFIQEPSYQEPSYQETRNIDFEALKKKANQLLF